MPDKLVEKSGFLKGETLLYIDASYSMVHIPCFEKVYLQIRNQSGCFCETSFLKAGLYCTRSSLTIKFTISLLIATNRTVAKLLYGIKFVN